MVGMENGANRLHRRAQIWQNRLALKGDARQGKCIVFLHAAQGKSIVFSLNEKPLTLEPEASRLNHISFEGLE